MSATKKARKQAVDESSTEPNGKLKNKDYERGCSSFTSSW